MVDFVGEGAAIQDELVALRRRFHQIPELGLKLPQTKQLVLDSLVGLGLEITEFKRCDGLAAVLTGGRPGPTVLLRGDMDALPVAEQTGIPFASTNGNMHACGHDLHISGLVGAARLLAAHRDELPGKVLFMFQPGEEGPGGAQPMLDEGLLDVTGEKPIAAYGLHVMTGPMGPRGFFATRRGPVMAGSNDLHITVHGKGGHGSQPPTTLDPVPVLAEIITGLQAYITRHVDVFDPIVLSVTMLEAGTAINAIPDEAKLGATVRTLSRESFEQLGRDLPRLAEHIAAAHGCTATVDFSLLYPVTVNDPDHTDFALETLRDLFGDGAVVEMPKPLMGSEDFSVVLEQVPGAYYYLCATPPDVDPKTAPSNHSPRARYDDAVLGRGAASLAALAFRTLTGAAD
jgi:hippurate hydrolase